MPYINKLAAEFLGTACLVFVGCGAAIFAAMHMEQAASVQNIGAGNYTVNSAVDNGIGWIGVALTFGLVVMCMAYAIGHISGCHLNPAVTLGLCAAKRFKWSELPGYVAAQVIGAIVGAVTLYMIAKGGWDGFRGEAIKNFASNGYEFLNHGSPLGIHMWSAFFAEMIFTGIFLFIIIGSTSEKAPKGFAPIAIGLGLTMIHLALIPLTNCSVNPARSTATALIGAGFSKDADHTWALHQLWLFWVAPLLGGLLGGLIYRFLSSAEEVEEGEEAPKAKKKKAAVVEESTAYDPNAAFDIGGGTAPKPKPKA